jgi:hypothetical protein|tara:strand:+ start:259 stop:483 length:225 start_codon:yes stop_codon:yes gene_type:complete
MKGQVRSLALKLQSEKGTNPMKIEVDLNYYNLIQKDSHLLECLMYCGVDMWDGFEEALIMYEEDQAEEEHSDES